MPKYLCLSVHFLDPVPAFHGRGDADEPEWPPSPLRAFQALVAAAASCWREQKFDDYARPAMEWLQRQEASIILAPSHQVGVAVRIAVPNNDLDVVANAWSVGKVPNKQPNELKTMKTLRPVHLLPKNDAAASVHYLYQIPEGECPHFEILQAASRSITHLGWGVDMVAANAEILSQDDADKLQGLRWRPVPSGGTPLRIPIEGTLSALKSRHQSFLNRLSEQGFVPVPPLTTFDVVGYHCSMAPSNTTPTRPFLAFSILKTDDSGLKAFDTVRRTRDVAGMVRCAVAHAARQFGWTEDRINSFIHGHGSEKTGQATTDDRLMFLPLPSITPLKVENIRRVMVVAPAGGSTKELRNLLNGVELFAEGAAEPVAMLALLPQSDPTVKKYTQPSSLWSTVTPVLLPGYDDPGHLRRKLQNGSDSATQKRMLDKLNTRALQLLQKAFLQAGFPKDLVDQIHFDWSSVGFRPGVDLASKYVRPENLNKFPAYHVQVRFPMRFQGPLAIGAGRYRGFGLFAGQSD